MLSYLIITGLIIYVVYLIVDTESYNPFTISKRASRDAGFIIGAAPKTLHTANSAAKALHAESKLELAKTGKDVEFKFAVGKRAGSIAAHKAFDEADKEFQARQKAAEEELEGLIK